MTTKEPKPAEEITLTTAKAELAITELIQTKTPVCLWGPPGIGKSDLIRKIADKLYASNHPELRYDGVQLRDDTGELTAKRPYLRDIRAALLDPTDLRGLPYFDGGRAKWAIPEFLPTTGQGIIFLDELNRATQLVQNACLQLIKDNQLGEYELPKGWVKVSACNRESDGGGVVRISQALANRFVHVNVEPDIDDWSTWAIDNSINPMTIAFLRYRPVLLYEFSRNAHAYPTPRSWEFVAKITETPSHDPEIELALIAGAVGTPAAIQYAAFLQVYRTLPNIDAIFLDPMNVDVPTDVQTQYAAASAIARRIKDSNFGRALQFLMRMPREFTVFAVQSATRRDKTLRTTLEFTRFAIKYQEVL